MKSCRALRDHAKITETHVNNELIIQQFKTQISDLLEIGAESQE